MTDKVASREKQKSEASQKSEGMQKSEASQKPEAVVNSSTFDDINCSSGDTERHDPDAKKIEELTAENALLHAELEKLKKHLHENSSDVAEAENTLLRQEVLDLKQELEKKRSVFDFNTISHSDLLVFHYTGIPNKETFLIMLKMFDDTEIIYYEGSKVEEIDKMNQLFLTLVKLRRGLSDLDLALRFGIEKSIIPNVFITWVSALHHVFFKCLMATIPSRKKNQIELPECFSDYPDTRIIIDCLEVVTACPLPIKNNMSCNYKQRMTCKGLVGVAPNGMVTFASKLYPAGSTSDKAIVQHCGILELLTPGDSLMAKRKFCIDDLIPEGVTLNVPFQVSAEEIALTLKVHVERAFERITIFQILNYIPEYLLPFACDIFQVCAALTNFRKPLMNDDPDGDD